MSSLLLRKALKKRNLTIIILFHRGGTEAQAQLSDFPKVTELINSEVELAHRSSNSKSLILCTKGTSGVFH